MTACALQDVYSAAEVMTNEELCQLLDQSLHINARPIFAAAEIEPASIQQTNKFATHKVITPEDQSSFCQLYDLDFAM